MYCKVCGNLLEENDLICKVCGADIQEQRRQTVGGAAFADILPDGRAETEIAFTQELADEANAFAAQEGALSRETANDGEAAFVNLPDDILPDDDALAIDADETVVSEAAACEPAAEDTASDAESAARRETAGSEFQWNIHQFPSAEIRKTEDVDFDWNLSPAVFDTHSDGEDEEDSATLAAGANADTKSLDDFFALYARESEGIEAEKDDGAQGESDAGAADGTAEPAGRTPVFIGLDARREADTDLQRFFANETDGLPDDEDGKGNDAPAWLRAESAPDAFELSLKSSDGAPARDRFFTFDQKNEEFQKLLDKEYERLQGYNSPIVNKARAMLAEWDLPTDFANKRTDPATKKWTPSMFRDQPEREADHADADSQAGKDAGEDAPILEGSAAANAEGVEEVAGAAVAAHAHTAAEAAPPQDIDLPATEEPVEVSAVEDAAEESSAEEPQQAEDATDAGEPQQAEIASDAEEPQQAEGAADAEEPQQAESATGAEEPQQAESATDAEEPQQAEAATDAEEPQQTESATDAEEPQQAEDATDAEEPQQAESATDTEGPQQTEAVTDAEEPQQAEAVTDAEGPQAEGPQAEIPAATEAELSISKSLDAIEKGIEEWESRERLSTLSKVAIVISIIFLLFTGGSAAVKHFLPHSPADVWFDSVQLRMAVTIKHGVDAVRDLFDGSDAAEENADAEES